MRLRFVSYVIIGMLTLSAALAGCAVDEGQDSEDIGDISSIDSFEECLEAGNPVMESYPRQCRADGQVFVEETDESGPGSADVHHCTEEEKAAEFCTMQYDPVCGDNGKTYGNGCVACSSGEIESYTPGECGSSGQADEEESLISSEEAFAIAQDSGCTEKGNLTDSYNYNSNSRTWWIDLDMEEEFAKEGCSPACVVYEETENATINWRCTGLITD